MRLASGISSRKASPARSRATRANSLQVLSASSAPSFSVAAIQAQRSAQNVRLAGSNCVETASIRRLRVLRGRNRSSTAPPASNQVATVSYFCSHLADARCAPCAAAVLVRSGGSSASSASTLAKGEMLSGWSGPSPSVSATREVGIAACPRCTAIHGSDDRFCPGCGLAFDAKADRPISTAPVSQQRQSAPPGAPTAPAPVAPTAPAPAPQPARAPATPPATPARAPELAKEDEPTQIIRPTSTNQ